MHQLFILLVEDGIVLCWLGVCQHRHTLDYLNSIVAINTLRENAHCEDLCSLYIGHYHFMALTRKIASYSSHHTQL